jgi:nucleoid-associated protein YgaU
VIRDGDILSRIADRVYGDPRKWARIWLANRDRLENPNRLKVGVRLVIPPGAPDVTEEERDVLRAFGEGAGGG